MGTGESKRSVTYIVVGPGRGAVNDRVEKVAALSSSQHCIRVVSASSQDRVEGPLVVRPWPNPAGLLGILGLHGLRRKLDTALIIPTRTRFYLLAVIRRLARKIERDLRSGTQVNVLTCAPPHGVCVIGQVLKRRYPAVRWLIDWQDLWSFDENYFHRIPLWRRDRALEMERAFLSEADMNITTNERARDVLIQNYRVPRENVTAIPHPYSDADMTSIQAVTGKEAGRKSDGIIRLGFMGSLFKPPRVPGNELVKALKAMRLNGLSVELHVHGAVPSMEQDDLDQLQQAGIIFHGMSTHMESLSAMLRYDYLLLLLADLPNSRVVMSIKLPHYLATGKPIIAIVPEDSAASDLIRSARAGFVIPVTSDWTHGLSNVLRDLAEKRCVLDREENVIRQFEWNNLSLKWREALLHPG